MCMCIHILYKLTMFEKMQGGASLTPSSHFQDGAGPCVGLQRLHPEHRIAGAGWGSSTWDLPRSSKKCGHVGVNMGQPLWFDGFFSGFSRVMLDYRRVCRVSGAEGLHVWERRREVTFVSKLTGEEEYCAILCLLDFMLMDFG